MKQTAIRVLVAALIAAVPATLRAQAASTVERFEEPFDALVQNPCNGEVVEITGTLKIALRMTVDANGVTHIAYNLVPKVRGEGASGAYKVVGGERSSEKFDEQFDSFSINNTFQFNIISQGRAPNFITTISSHFTITDGTITRDVFHINERCTGR